MNEQTTDRAVTPEPIETIPHSDWYLSEFVKFSNKGLQFPVTLYCGGLLVTGIMIGGREYFERFSSQMQESFSDPESREVMATWVASWADIYAPSAPANPDEGDEPQDDHSPGYVHLRNAKVFAPGQQPIPGGKEGVLWRGRLSSVDGFSWGRLALSED